MKVLVDTSVWSLALRRRTERANAAVDELRSLIDEGRVAMLGIVRQELLSGIRTREAFEQLRDHLRPFSENPSRRPTSNGRRSTSIHAGRAESRDRMPIS